MTDLAAQRCAACNRDTPTLTDEELRIAKGELSSGWTVRDGVLNRHFATKDFAAAFALTSAIAEIAEEQGHHPDLHLGWGYVDVDLVTHAADGLTTNDLIVAAKIDRV